MAADVYFRSEETGEREPVYVAMEMADLKLRSPPSPSSPKTVLKGELAAGGVPAVIEPSASSTGRWEGAIELSDLPEDSFAGPERVGATASPEFDLSDAEASMPGSLEHPGPAAESESGLSGGEPGDCLQRRLSSEGQVGGGGDNLKLAYSTTGGSCDQCARSPADRGESKANAGAIPTDDLPDRVDGADGGALAVTNGDAAGNGKARSSRPRAPSVRQPAADPGDERFPHNPTSSSDEGTIRSAGGVSRDNLALPGDNLVLHGGPGTTSDPVQIESSLVAEKASSNDASSQSCSSDNAQHVCASECVGENGLPPGEHMAAISPAGELVSVNSPKDKESLCVDSLDISQADDTVRLRHPHKQHTLFDVNHPANHHDHRQMTMVNTTNETLPNSHVPEPKSSHMELQTFTKTARASKPKKTKSKTKSITEEPVLMTYRRHSDDPLRAHAQPDVGHVSQPGSRPRSESRKSDDVSLSGVQVEVARPQKFQLSKKMMAKVQSPRIQCCLCACSVFSVLFGVFMLSVGVCLVLNYNFLEVDTSGLPSNLHNEEGKKVVGIILICVGIASMLLGGLVSTLYFTACGPAASPSPPPAAAGHKDGRSSSSNGSGDAEQGSAGKGRMPGQARPSSHEGHRHHRNGGAGHRHHHHHHHHLNGIGSLTGRNSPRMSGRHTGSLPNLRVVGSGGGGAAAAAAAALPGGPLMSAGLPTYARGATAGGSGTPPGARGSGSGSRHGKGKSRHHVLLPHGRYQHTLPSHKEEEGAEAQSLNESRNSAASRKKLLFPDLKGHDNLGATGDDDWTLTSRESSTVSSTTPSYIIRVESYAGEAGEGRPLTYPGAGGAAYLARPAEDFSVPVESGCWTNPSVLGVTEAPVRDWEEQEEDGRGSRSTQDSDTATSDSRTLNDQILELVS